MIGPTLYTSDLGRSVRVQKDGYSFVGKIGGINNSGCEVYIATETVGMGNAIIQNHGWHSYIECTFLNHEPSQPETTGMNYSITAFLLNPKCRAVTVSYDKDSKGEPLDIKLTKTLDETIAKGDLVIVPTSTRYGFTVCKVVETDVDWEPDTQENVQWIVGKVNPKDFEDLKAAEAEMIQLAKDSEKTDKRKKLQEKMFAHIDQAALNNLSLARAGGNTVTIEHKPATAGEPSQS